MATRHCFMLNLSLLILALSASSSATAELRPVKAWNCTTESLPDRAITLYEYRSAENCLEDALPPDGTLVCRADYTKDGATETLWRARNKRDFCRPRAEALVRDLVDAGFFCKTIDVEGCDGPADVQDDAAPEADEAPEVETASEVETAPEVDAQPVTEAKSVVRNTTPIDRTASREKQLLTFFNGLFDTSLAKAMTTAAIPSDFEVLDGSTLSGADGETLHFTKGTHAWETRRDAGVLVINADFQHGTSFNDVFFGFTFDRRGATNEPDRHQFRYLGVVSPETSSEVVFAGEDKIIISSKWYAESGECYSSQTTDEYHWSDSIYGTLQMRTVSTVDNPDCAEQ